MYERFKCDLRVIDHLLVFFVSSSLYTMVYGLCRFLDMIVFTCNIQKLNWQFGVFVFYLCLF